MERSDDTLNGSVQIANIQNGDLNTIMMNSTSANASNNISTTTVNNNNGQTTTTTNNYTMPGILHYLQHEWNRFEFEKQQWEIERAEMMTKISFLQGERRGQENLKINLIRRIKMLELALRQERIKYHKLKYGTEPSLNDLKQVTQTIASSNESNNGCSFLFYFSFLTSFFFNFCFY